MLTSRRPRRRRRRRRSCTSRVNACASEYTLLVDKKACVHVFACGDNVAPVGAIAAVLLLLIGKFVIEKMNSEMMNE